MVLLLLMACPERVTGEPRPLDPRFTAGGPGGGTAQTVVMHDPNAGPADPFATDDGDQVVISGTLICETGGGIDMDIMAADPQAPGGMAHLGKLLFEGPGPFSIEAPEGTGSITLQAFQDVDGNGPSDLDPFAAMTVVVQDEDIDGVELDLVVGGRALAQLASASGGNMFGDHEGDWTAVQLVAESPSDSPLVVDVRTPDPNAPSGDAYLGKLQFPRPGPIALKVPRGFGELTLQVFQDEDTDGPDATDPFAQTRIEVGREETMDLGTLTLVPGGFAMPGAEAAPAPAPSAAEPVFADLGEAPVTLSGTLTLRGLEAEQVDLDVFAVDPEGQGGKRYVGKLKVAPGPWSFQAPRDVGGLFLEALVDRTGDGPTGDDPRGSYAGNPVLVGGQDLSGLDLFLPSGT
jgi:hypothetical protein